MYNKYMKFNVKNQSCYEIHPVLNSYVVNILRRVIQMRDRKAVSEFVRGLHAGIPIGLGYLSVSFTFGIMSVSYGFTWWQALVISMTTVTSAGQFAGIGVMLYPGHYLEMLLSQFTINVRYSFMSISLSQKADRQFRGIFRWLLGFFVTDEIFAVAVMEESVSRSFFAGLSMIPYLGWSMGTLIGALLGNILPARLMSALSLAIYGMFVAIVVPEMKRKKEVIIVVVIAFAASCLFYYVPLLKGISSGLAISICAVAAAALGALMFPVKTEEEAE